MVREDEPLARAVAVMTQTPGRPGATSVDRPARKARRHLHRRRPAPPLREGRGHPNRPVGEVMGRDPTTVQETMLVPEAARVLRESARRPGARPRRARPPRRPPRRPGPARTPRPLNPGGRPRPHPEVPPRHPSRMSAVSSGSPQAEAARRGELDFPLQPGTRLVDVCVGHGAGIPVHSGIAEDWKESLRILLPPPPDRQPSRLGHDFLFHRSRHAIPDCGGHPGGGDGGRGIRRTHDGGGTGPADPGSGMGKVEGTPGQTGALLGGARGEPVAGFSAFNHEVRREVAEGSEYERALHEARMR